MPSGAVEEFVRRLRQAEQTGDPGPLAELFADDAELLKPAAHDPDRGRDGARRFWDGYLRAFDHVESTFTRVLEAGAIAVLEWTSDGALPDGRPVRYDGVSILELDGDRLRRFRTYYDSAAFLHSPAAAAR